MIKPPKLFPGATIGIVSPSWWLKESVLQQSAEIFKARGYNLQLGQTNFLQYDQYAGTPEERATDIMDMFSNPEIDAIFCARGGYGANRVLPLLDYDLIKKNPKIFMGFSDITAYLLSITQKTSLVTFHGPMLITFKDQARDYNFEMMERILIPELPVRITPPADFPATILKPGRATGPLWGGNLTLISNRLATPDQLKTENIILFLEDTNEYFYALDRLLVHLRTAGIFSKINGLIIGELTEMKDNEVPFGKTTDEIVMDICGDLPIPIITNFPCGHGDYQVTLPISVPVELDASGDQPNLTIPESPVV